jgi:hypothetical protein
MHITIGGKMPTETETSPYVITVFGKEGCDKCKALKGRLGRVLQDKRFSQFRMQYHDVMTIDGKVAFANAETVNGQRIPTMQVLKWNEKEQRYERMNDPRPQRREQGRLIVPTYLQLETDYSDPSRATIKPTDIEGVLDLALRN